MRLRHILLISAWLLACAASAQGHNDTIRVMTFNLHAGHDASLQQLGQFIKRYQPDFVALQEVDHNTRRSNCPHQNDRDFITELAYYSGMQGLFGPTIQFSGGHYGIGLLTRHQFVDVHNILAGDFNASPDDPVIGQLMNQWLDCTTADFTFSVNTPSEKIDYILAQPKGVWRTIESQVIPVELSDHYPVIATLILTHD